MERDEQGRVKSERGRRNAERGMERDEQGRVKSERGTGGSERETRPDHSDVDAFIKRIILDIEMVHSYRDSR